MLLLKRDRHPLREMPVSLVKHVNFLSYMRQDALVSSLCIHIHDRDQLVASFRAGDDIQPGFGYAQDI